MNEQRREVVRVSIEAPPPDVVSFLRNANNWKTWAPWIRSVKESTARDWTLDTEAGPMRMHFADPNAPGILDHEVTLESGVKVFNSLRVSQSSSGSELAMVVVQQPGASIEDFERDVQAVRDDFGRLKKVVEATTKESRDSTESVRGRL